MKLTFEYRFYADSFCLCVFEKKKQKGNLEFVNFLLQKGVDIRELGRMFLEACKVCIFIFILFLFSVMIF